MRYLQRGVTLHNERKAARGYTLFSPLLQRHAYLIDMAGEVVHRWELPDVPGNYGYLEPSGNLLIATRFGTGPEGLPARGGLIGEYSWDGKLLWSHLDDH